MGFRPDDPVMGPLALPQDFDLNPEASPAPDVPGGFIGAAFRRENPIGSMMSSERFDMDTPFDPEFRAYEDIEGTYYEQFADRFAGARNAQHSAMIKAQIDQEVEDRRAIDAAGGWGFAAEMAAGLLSPTNLLPGGAVVKGVQGGVRIGKTAMSVAGATGLAVALDELALQATQEIRTPEESALAIGGSMILGGLLGGAVGGMSSRAYLRSSAAAELIPEAIHDYDAGLRSIGAAENRRDMEVRREQWFQALNESQFRFESRLMDYGLPETIARAAASPLAITRPLVRSDEILRQMLQPFREGRSAMARMVETPLQFAANEKGMSVRPNGASVETKINRRRNMELAGTIGSYKKLYAEYLNDGANSKVATISAPVRGSKLNFLRDKEKKTFEEFMRLVGEARLNDDKHPIPQVQRAAELSRKTIYEPAKNEGIEVGLFDEDLQLKHDKSYMHRSYLTEKIRRHRGDQSEDDFQGFLERKMAENSQMAQRRLENDDTVERAQDQLFKTRQKLRNVTGAFKTAVNKARGKRDRAKAAIAREGAVQRSMSNLEKFFDDRAKGLMEGVMEGEEFTAFKDLIKKLRRLDKLEPPSLLKQIRSFGGIKDPRIKNQWRNGDWVSDGTRTDLEEILDKQAITVRRNEGMEIDMMREALAESGYLPRDSTVNDLLDLIAQEARGQKVYSEYDQVELAEWEALSQIADEFDRMGIDVSAPIEKIIPKLPGVSKSQKITRAKAGEAARSAKETGKRADRSKSLDAALARYSEAQERLSELGEDIAPVVREEKKALRQQIKDEVTALDKARKARGADEFYANLDDLAIKDAARDAVDAILGMRPGENLYSVVGSSPTRARVLDVPTNEMIPWLEMDASRQDSLYFNSIMPEIEMRREFGDLNLTLEKDRMREEMDRILQKGRQVGTKADGTPIYKPWTEKQRARLQTEYKERVKGLDGMRDRLLGRYATNTYDPDSVWMVAQRAVLPISYMGHLGGMVLSALPDVPHAIGRNFVEAGFGAIDAVTDPKRVFDGIKDAAEWNAGAEWTLNNRAMAWADVVDQYQAQSSLDRTLSKLSQGFSVATGMIPWNVIVKSPTSLFTASRMAKAATDMAAGKATRKQMLALGANDIEPWMAERIAKQMDKHGDKNGLLWITQANKWDDIEAREAFANAMNREANINVITPGQDKPFAFSGPLGKVIFQFKTFGFSAYHRIVLAGLQRADAEFAMTALGMLVVGGMVSNIKSWQHNQEPKTGAAFWEDAFDRSGLGGPLMEGYGIANALTGGATSLTGEEMSRFRSRSEIGGLVGPSVDMGISFGEAISAFGRGEVSESDVRKLFRPVPYNNHPITDLLGIGDRLEKAIADIY